MWAIAGLILVTGVVFMALGFWVGEWFGRIRAGQNAKAQGAKTDTSIERYRALMRENEERRIQYEASLRKKDGGE